YRVFCAAALLIATPAPAHPALQGTRRPAPDSAVVAVMPLAPVIFAGTVQRLIMTVGSPFRRPARAAIVRVDSVYKAPKEIGNIRRSLVTVLISDTSSVSAGTSEVFFARGI